MISTSKVLGLSLLIGAVGFVMGAPVQAASPEESSMGRQQFNSLVSLNNPAGARVTPSQEQIKSLSLTAAAQVKQIEKAKTAQLSVLNKEYRSGMLTAQQLQSLTYALAVQTQKQLIAVTTSFRNAATASR